MAKKGGALGSYIPKSLEQTINHEKKHKIQQNLKQLFKNIKTKQASHLRQHSQNFIVKRQQELQLQEYQKSAAMNSLEVELIQRQQAMQPQSHQLLRPQKKLYTKFFSGNQRFADARLMSSNNISDTLIEQETGNAHSNSLTPVRDSRKSGTRDNDLSIDYKDDY